MQSKDVFILGAGFSYAATDGRIPAMSGLMTRIKKAFRRKHPEDFTKVSKYNDFEFMLSDLFLKQPYGNNSSYHRNLSTYYKVVETLVEVLHSFDKDYVYQLEEFAKNCLTLVNSILNIEHRASRKYNLQILEDEIKKFPSPIKCFWLNSFVGYLINLKDNQSVITFNYDKLFEIEACIQIIKSFGADLASSKVEPIHIKYLFDSWQNSISECLYAQKVPYSDSRFSSLYAAAVPDIKHLKLLKLHGSLNLRWDRDTNSPVYLEDDSSDDLEPFIIPPVLDKTNELAHPYLKLNWRLAAEALKEAERVFIIGYSVPLTDFSTRAMLFNSQFDKQNRKKKKFKVYPVNVEYPESLSAIFSNDLIAKQYCFDHQDSNNKTAIEKFVEDLVNDQI